MLFLNLLKDSVIYGVGTVIPKAFVLLVIPILIGYFSPEDYGRLELVLTFCSFLQVLMGLALESGQSFYFFKYRHQKENVVKTIFYARLINGIFIVFLSVFFSSVIIEFIGIGSDKKQLLFYALFFSLFTQLYIQLSGVFRLLFKPVVYVLLVNFQIIVNQFFSIILAVYMDFGIVGYFIGLFIGMFLTMFLTMFLSRKWFLKGKFDKRILYATLKFSLPLLPASLSMYLIMSLDRWMINYYLEPSHLGVFALGGKMAIAFKLAIDVFRKAWWPYGLKILNTPEGKGVFRMISMFYALAVSIGLISISYIIPWFLKYLDSSDYAGAEHIAIILCIEAVIYGYFLVGGIGIWKSEKTYINTILMVVGLIVNVVLNVFLIPEYGIKGAAFATVFSSLVWCLLSIIISNYFWNFYANNLLISFLVFCGVLLSFDISGLIFFSWSVSMSLFFVFLVSSLIAIQKILKLSKVIKG